MAIREKVQVHASCPTCNTQRVNNKCEAEEASGINTIHGSGLVDEWNLKSIKIFKKSIKPVPTVSSNNSLKLVTMLYINVTHLIIL